MQKSENRILGMLSLSALFMYIWKVFDIIIWLQYFYHPYLCFPSLSFKFVASLFINYYVFTFIPYLPFPNSQLTIILGP